MQILTLRITNNEGEREVIGMKNTSWLDQNKQLELIKKYDPVNAEYILMCEDIMGGFERAAFHQQQLNTEMEEFLIKKTIEKIKEYDKHHLTPANVKVGDGATICLWSDRHAGTIIKVTKKTVTVRRDKATLDPNFKPEFIPGGFAAHCTNQSEQTYTYEPDEKGQVETFRWSDKYQSYGTPGNCRLIKGRHEFYDYNF